jgi:hypothetical protein
MTHFAYSVSVEGEGTDALFGRFFLLTPVNLPELDIFFYSLLFHISSIGFKSGRLYDVLLVCYRN